MSDQKPSVGRVVHFYGEPQGWKYSMAVPEDAEFKKTFVGPFSATVVRVNGDGTVNLRVDYPTMLMGTDRSSELVLAVPELLDGGATPGWVWPPRV